jgi:hypothetical protein
MRQVAKEYNQTPEALAKQRQFNTPLMGMNGEDYAVDIPDMPPDLYDYTNFDKAEDW